MWHNKIKLLLVLPLLCLCGSVLAQSHSPECQGGDTTSQNNCFGVKNFANVVKYDVTELAQERLNKLLQSKGNNITELPKCKSSQDEGVCIGILNYDEKSLFGMRLITSYSGQFYKKIPNGFGVLEFNTGDKYVGLAKDGSFNTTGIHYQVNGEILVGNLSEINSGDGVRIQKRFKPRLSTGLIMTSLTEELKKVINYQGTGMLVRQVTPNKPASISGIVANDVLVKINNIEVTSNSFYKLIQGMNFNENIFEVWRKGNLIKINVIPEELTTIENIFMGSIKDGIPNGEGSYNYRNGDKYVGEWKDGERKKGSLTFANGDKYVGDFNDNLSDGQGTLYSSNGSILKQGLWVGGKFVSSTAAPQASSTNSLIPSLTTPSQKTLEADAGSVPLSQLIIVYKPDMNLFYPKFSKENGESGIVEIRMQIGENGLVASTQVVSSSGYARLDRAASVMTSLIRFRPHLINDVPSKINATISVKFDLTKKEGS